MISCDANTLANLAGCLACLRGDLLAAVQISLLCNQSVVVNLFSCDATFLQDQAKCLSKCTSGSEREAIKVWQLSGLTKTTPDPQTLANGINCLSCGIPNGLIDVIETFLIAANAGSSLDPNVLADQAKCYFECVPEHDPIKVWLLAQLAGRLPVPPDPNFLNIDPTFLKDQSRCLLCAFSGVQLRLIQISLWCKFLNSFG